MSAAPGDMQFASNVLDPSRAMIRGALPNLMPSLGVDLRAGNKLELPWLAGRVVQLGAAHGVPTPVNRVVYAALKPYANGTPGVTGKPGAKREVIRGPPDVSSCAEHISQPQAEARSLKLEIAALPSALQL